MTKWILLGVAAAVVLVATWVLLSRKNPIPDEPLVSVVLLCNEPRTLTADDVRGAYRRAYGQDPTLEENETDGGNAKTYLVMTNDVPPMGVIVSSKPYMNKEDAANSSMHMESQVVRDAILKHRAWISVDAMATADFTEEEKALVHKLLARLASEFYDDQCVLLFLPADQRVAAPGPNVATMLHEGKLEELFGDDSLHARMQEVAADDAEIEAAIAEAKRRLPEFLAAFERRTSKGTYMFKARFQTPDGGVEVIWMTLLEVKETELVGTIENAPIANNIPKQGERATRSIDQVVDWIYAEGDTKPVGLFVDSILMKRGAK